MERLYNDFNILFLCGGYRGECPDTPHAPNLLPAAIRFGHRRYSQANTRRVLIWDKYTKYRDE